MKTTKRKTPLIWHIIFIAIALACAIIVGTIFIVSNSLAWFSKNSKVDANGMAVSLKDLGITDLYYIRYGDGEFSKIASGSYAFNNLTPGDTVTIKAVYLSEEQDTRTLDIYFRDMNKSETPIIKEGKYYYFGTQLRVTQKAVNGTAEAMNEFLVTPPENKIYYEQKLETVANDILLAQKLAPVALDTVDVSDVKLNEDPDVDLTGKKIRTMEITVEFINYPDVDQNDYQRFGKTEGFCLRQLIAYVIE